MTLKIQMIFNKNSQLREKSIRNLHSEKVFLQHSKNDFMSPAELSRHSRGIVYLAVGERFVAEAAVSSRSMRRHLNLPCTIFTNFPDNATRTDCFDQIVSINTSGRRAHRDKLVAMRDSPYDETLFLDTDTFIGAPLDDCWKLLEQFDIAFSSDRGYVDRFPAETGVPDSFKEPNLGVVFYRRSDEMDRLFNESLKTYDKFSNTDVNFFNDQTPFRIALYYSTLRFSILTDEDNCRFTNYGKLNGKCRVLHGRLKHGKFDEKTLSCLLDRLNATTVPRVFAAGTVIALWPRRFNLVHQYRPKYMPKTYLVDYKQLFCRIYKRIMR